jgi:DNA-binding MarR family transcriptional regulator
MYSMWLTDDQQHIWRGYLAMVSKLQTAMNRQLQQDCGLSLPDYEVLVALSEYGPQRISDLGEILVWEQSRLSHQLRRMRSRGLVERHGSDDDRRSAIVEISTGGLQALATAAPGHAQLVRSTVFDGLSTTQLRAFGAVIETVLERLA